MIPLITFLTVILTLTNARFDQPGAHHPQQIPGQAIHQPMGHGQPPNQVPLHQPMMQQQMGQQQMGQQPVYQQYQGYQQQYPGQQQYQGQQFQDQQFQGQFRQYQQYQHPSPGHQQQPHQHQPHQHQHPSTTMNPMIVCHCPNWKIGVMCGSEMNKHHESNRCPDHVLFECQKFHHFPAVKEDCQGKGLMCSGKRCVSRAEVGSCKVNG